MSPSNRAPPAVGWLTIVTGGQTGVDRGALDGALESGLPCGGWCPRGRRAEDGRIPEHYPLRECRGGYEQRTRRNVRDSDGTLVVFFDGRIEGGTAVTVEAALRFRRPLLLVDATALPPRKAAQRVAEWIQAEGIQRLNVAGPRESQAPGAARYAHALIHALATFLTRSTTRIKEIALIPAQGV